MGGVIAQEYAIAHGSGCAPWSSPTPIAAADPFTRAAFESWAVVAETAGMAVMMRQQAPWIYSPGFYERHPERVEELIAEAQKSTQPPPPSPPRPRRSSTTTRRAGGHDHDTQRSSSPRATTSSSGRRSPVASTRPSRTRRWSVVPGGHAAFWEEPRPWNLAVIDFVRAHGAL